jgi:hypothetical protein
LGDLSVGGSVILKLIFRNGEGVKSSSSEHSNGFSDSKKARNLLTN